MSAHSALEKIRIPISRIMVVASCLLLMLSRSGWEKISIVNPKIFRKNVFGALWFVWMVGMIETIEALHEAGIFLV